MLPSGRLLIAGGSKEVEVFDPASGKFVVAAGQMSEPLALYVGDQAYAMAACYSQGAIQTILKRPQRLGFIVLKGAG